ncbi:MAG: Co2+/Mg2+ efflux protein ApaG [Acetobacteraceae bacterium]|nr:Co2+/Mg2+ efflux protein ApaG [Acetobacteraceae bacterium]
MTGGKSGGGGTTTDAPAGDYTQVTRSIRVTVRAAFLADRSRPDEHEYFWAYTVTIANEGSRRVQLLKRTWHITDAAGRTQHVHGLGVIGEQPVLDPGACFEYTSGTPLGTATGFMRGLYHMIEADSGAAFDVEIPAFSLDSPHQAATRLN